MDLRLSGKVAIVTGASKGIGLAMTRALVAEGACVVAGAREFSDAEVQPDVRARLHHVALDLSTPDGPAQLVKQAVATFGALDIVVNNVGGVRPRLGGFLSLTDDDWSWGLNINRTVARRGRSGRNGRSGPWRHAGRRRSSSSNPVGDRAVHASGGGRRPGGLPCERSLRQRHRRELHHRRWADHQPLSDPPAPKSRIPTSPGCTDRATGGR